MKPFMARRVKYLRNEAGFKQEDLANASDVSIGTIRNIEQGVNVNPSVAIMIKIADIFNTTVNDLIYEEK